MARFQNQIPALESISVLPVCSGKWSRADNILGESWASDLGPPHSGASASLGVDVSRKALLERRFGSFIKDMLQCMSLCPIGRMGKL